MQSSRATTAGRLESLFSMAIVETPRKEHAFSVAHDLSNGVASCRHLGLQSLEERVTRLFAFWIKLVRDRPSVKIDLQVLRILEACPTLACDMLSREFKQVVDASRNPHCPRGQLF